VVVGGGRGYNIVLAFPLLIQSKTFSFSKMHLKENQFRILSLPYHKQITNSNIIVSYTFKFYDKSSFS